MSDENDKHVESDEAGADGGGPVAGERLAEARREQQIPVIEIAKELHLDEHKVRALERNEFEVIGAAVFAKGHLRKYAQLVNVDQADVMADYYQLDRSAAAPPVITTRPRPRQTLSPGPWVAVIVVLVIAASAYWWFVEREVTTPAENPVIGTVAPLPQPREDTSETDPVTEDIPLQQESSDAPAEAIVEVAEEPEPEPEPASQAMPDSTETQISLSYSGDCWTEITDANGRRLFFELGKSGRTVNLSGEAPFNVLLGNADNVSIDVDGATYRIPASQRRGRTARLTIASP